jgi:hypothetical protein
MTPLKSLAIALSITLAGGAAHAQTARTPRAADVAPQAADMIKWQTAMMAAQAAALKPGDEALPCEALHKELVSTMNDPAIQAYAAKTNATFAKDLAARDQKTPMTADYAAAMAAALAPNMAMAAGTMPMAPAPGQQMTPQQMQQAMQVQQQAMVTYMNQLAPIMPSLMRTQRVTQLAAMKNCTWMTGSLGLYPGALVPAAVLPGGAPSRR